MGSNEDDSLLSGTYSITDPEMRYKKKKIPFQPSLRRWLILFIYTITLSNCYYVQLASSFNATQVQQNFSLETPLLVILSSLVFPIMNIPGVFVSYQWARNKQKYSIFLFATLFTLIGASTRSLVLVFNQNFMFVVAGNAMIGFS